MRMVLMGHRGAGKTQLLERLKVYFQTSGSDLKFFDLDQEIEIRAGKAISKIFIEAGETEFRNIEAQVFHELILKHKNWIISLGAGFRLQEIPKDVRRVWVKRPTDHLGRIFLDRPRLNSEVTPLEEYLERLPLREERYRQQASDQYLMPEGIRGPNDTEKKIFLQDFQKLGGIYTLLPSHFQNLENLQERIRKYDVDYFELRDDLLNLNQIQTVTSLLPVGRVLISLRTSQPNPWLLEFIKTGVLWDWASELGECPYGAPPIISIHQIDPKILKSQSTLSAHLSQISLKSHIKLSPIVEDFSTLKVLIDWQRSNPEKRSLLPRSRAGAEHGRWSWVRLWLKGRQKLNFFRSDQGSALDQPSLYEWLVTPPIPEKFAAVLGSPVFHSQSPLKHQEFFAFQKMPFFAILCNELEFEEALPLLQQIGLRAAAVTSPLKRKSYEISKTRTAVAQELKSSNTLVWKDDKWHSHNTDLIGFQKLFSQAQSQFQLDPNAVAVWGGGGTLPVILKVCPTAFCFSARTGDVKMEFGSDHSGNRSQMLAMKIEGPQTLIWAGAPEASQPPQSWHPEIVLDLNYREDSLAREYAGQVKAMYLSGLSMFEAQAKAQQEFWSG